MANAASSELVVFAPGLLGPYAGQEHWQAADWPSLPLLQKLLTRANRVKKPSPHVSDYTTLFSYFDLTPTENGFSLAALSLLAEGHSPGSDCWMRIDPVCLHPDRTEAILIAHDEMALNENEAAALQESIRPLLDEWSVTLIKTTPHHWYARLPEHTSLSTTALLEAKGLGISRLMPRGKDQIKWHGLMNEVQMLWYTHAVNLEREQQGRLQASSVWMWGCGSLPKASNVKFTYVYSDDLVATGLACLNNVSHSSLNEIDNLKLNDTSFICDFSWRQLQQNSDPQDWFQALEKWQTEFIQPLFEQLSTNKTQNVIFDFGGEFMYHINHKCLRHWWRRTKTFQQLACEQV